MQNERTMQPEIAVVHKQAKEEQVPKDREMVKEVEIRRKGKLYFTVHVHPVSEEDISFASKKASKYYENPQGKKLPRIRGEMDTNLFNSWLIYLGTVEDDREKIWGNPTVMKKLGHLKPVESINSLLMAGEKNELVDLIINISNVTDDGEEVSEEEYAKNSSR